VWWAIEAHVGSIVGHRDQVVLHDVVILLCHIVLAHRVLKGEVEFVMLLHVSVAFRARLITLDCKLKEYKSDEKRDILSYVSRTVAHPFICI
jgi:hypothetical protein